MRNFTFKKIIFLLLIFNFSFGQNLPLSKEAFVSVLTCGLGNESYSFFGHTAIHVADPANNIDVVYNYGAFDFSTPNFCLLYTSPSPRDRQKSRMPSSA